MMVRLTFLIAFYLCASACGRGAGAPDANGDRAAAQRIVSLDFCADQFVLKLADRKNILALSPDAEASFSYMRKFAQGVPKVRPRAEDVLLLHPDIVVRSYGGGPRATAFFERAGVRVVQIAYANDLTAVRQAALDAARDLGVPERGAALAREMDERLAALPDNDMSPSMLYMTSKGAVAGAGTSIDELMRRAGAENFQTAPGWGALPLERLAYQRPDMIAAGFFETSDLATDIWSPARHPLARRRLRDIPVVDIPGAWTACGGWFVLDAVEALAEGAAQYQKARP